jgi:hypothetical protein
LFVYLSKRLNHRYTTADIFYYIFFQKIAQEGGCINHQAEMALRSRDGASIALKEKGKLAQP